MRKKTPRWSDTGVFYLCWLLFKISVQPPADIMNQHACYDRYRKGVDKKHTLTSNLSPDFRNSNVLTITDGSVPDKQEHPFFGKTFSLPSAVCGVYDPAGIEPEAQRAAAVMYKRSSAAHDGASLRVRRKWETEETGSYYYHV